MEQLTNFVYTMSYSKTHTRDQDRHIAQKILLAYTDIPRYEWDQDTMDLIGVALIIDSCAGPSSENGRIALDWMAVCCVGLGTMGPEPLSNEVIDLKVSDNLVLRQNLYGNLVERANHLACCESFKQL